MEFDCTPARKLAKRIDIIRDGKEDAIDLTENDLVFITNGGCVENSSRGSQNEPAPYNTEIKPGGGWDMGARSPHRTRPSAILTSSAMTPSRRTG